mmetsp:Transcript_8112/g.34112  ORF Transcript_8112/g.34112 Transcript_8112/m.34112 type:complete len:242 (-) Transcript_8112:437-1162(-)
MRGSWCSTKAGSDRLREPAAVAVAGIVGVGRRNRVGTGGHDKVAAAVRGRDSGVANAARDSHGETRGRAIVGDKGVSEILIPRLRITATIARVVDRARHKRRRRSVDLRNALNGSGNVAASVRGGPCPGDRGDTAVRRHSVRESNRHRRTVVRSNRLSSRRRRCVSSTFECDICRHCNRGRINVNDPDKLHHTGGILAVAGGECAFDLLLAKVSHRCVGDRDRHRAIGGGHRHSCRGRGRR